MLLPLYTPYFIISKNRGDNSKGFVIYFNILL